LRFSRVVLFGRIHTSSQYPRYYVDIPANFEEILSAVGGGYDELASVVIKHISLGLTLPNSDMKVIMLSVALVFLDKTAAHDEFPAAQVS
jgi:hypothetical protein